MHRILYAAIITLLLLPIGSAQQVVAGDTCYRHYSSCYNWHAKAARSGGLVEGRCVDRYQLCMATGGPCIYTGRTMRASHAGLGITEDDWNTAVAHLVASLNKFKVGAKEQEELLAALGGMKKDIVGQ